MINYFDFVVCVGLAYAATFIKEERIFKRVKSVVIAIITIVVPGLCVYYLRHNYNTANTFIKSLIISMLVFAVTNILFEAFNIWFFSLKKRNARFNNIHAGCKIDTDLALKIMHITNDYLKTPQNVFDDGEPTIEFSSVTELLNEYNINSLENFINNIEYVKSKYSYTDTHLNEYNYINKVLYNFYNNIDDVKYNKIKEGLK